MNNSSTANRTHPITLSRRIVDDERISITTLGVWLLIKAQPHGTPVSLDSVTELIPGSRDAAEVIAEGAMAELKEYGYITEVEASK